MTSAPFPYFGGKRTIASTVWKALGNPKHYIEPFCGSAAVLLSRPSVPSLEVIGDANGFIANFWRATVAQPEEVARFADYPVSHIDLGARHVWMMEQRDSIAVALHDANYPGDAKLAGWWLWGQCCWIGSGWCDWDRQIPHVSDAGRGIQAIGKIPHVGNAGREMWTSAGDTALRLLTQLAKRMERVRVVHGEWSRCLNSHYGGNDTAVFLDPPYKSFEKLYGTESKLVAVECEDWARDNAKLRVILCGHVGDYELPGWTVHQWSRAGSTYSGSGTKDKECLWLSPACHKINGAQKELFANP